tara:strand:- start:2924 stop:3211 length:288 start_codon:yes stop_codon:yes gene_type:complete
MTKQLIQTCKQNVQRLKSSLGICESQITFGTQDVKNKYRKDKVSISKKLQEEMYWLTQYTLIDYVKEYLGGIMKEGQFTHEQAKSYLRSYNVKII